MFENETMIRTRAVRRDATRPWQVWEIAFVVALGGSIIVTVYIASRRLYLGFDDLVTATLVSDPSLSHMIRAIANGVETNPPLFFILEWLVAHVTGHGDFGLRILSAMSLAMTVPVVYATLRKTVKPEVASLALAFVLGLSRGAYEFAILARYYGWMILLAAIAACLFVQLNLASARRRDYFLVFAVHAGLVYTHLFGFFFSGALLLSHFLLDWLQRTFRWRLYASIVAAWASFAIWLPAMPRQLSVTKDGTYTPRFDVGTFFEIIEMQTPLGVILLLAAFLLLVYWLTGPAPSTPRETEVSVAAASLPVLTTLALAWFFVAVAAWAASQVIKPFFMGRYVAPCVLAWVFLFAAVLAGGYKVTAAAAMVGPFALPAWCPRLAWVVVLGGCIIWQPLRAWTEPAKGQPFADSDYGYATLPIVFEDAMDLLPRAIYGKGRDYVLLLDREAAKADTNYYTKLTLNWFERWRTFYPNVRILYYDELSPGPEGYLAVDDELAKTFDWIFHNKTDLIVEELGPWESGNTVYRVRPKT
jgi:hypothetical protein